MIAIRLHLGHFQTVQILTHQEFVISCGSVFVLLSSGVLSLHVIIKRNGLLSTERVAIDTSHGNVTGKASCALVFKLSVTTDGKPHIALAGFFICAVHVKFLGQYTIYIDVHHTLGRIVDSHNMVVFAALGNDATGYNLGFSTHVGFKRNLVALAAVTDKNLTSTAFVG